VERVSLKTRHFIALFRLTFFGVFGTFFFACGWYLNSSYFKKTHEKNNFITYYQLYHTDNANSDDDIKRAYQLQNIERKQPNVQSSQQYVDSPIIQTASVKNIADLYQLVKKYDKNFKPGKSVNEAMLNEDGTPKVFYHGTNEDFSVFDLAKS
jgi:hypothetical protein